MFQTHGMKEKLNKCKIAWAIDYIAAGVLFIQSIDELCEIKACSLC
jgi:hypothetical protein